MKQIFYNIHDFKKSDHALKYGVLNYRLVSFLIRFLFSLIFAVVLIWVIALVGGIQDILSSSRPNDYLNTALGFMLMMEAQIFTDKVLEHLLPIPNKIRLRIFVQSLCGIIYIIITYKLLMLRTHTTIEIPKHIVVIGLLFALIMITQLTSVLLTFRLTEKWIWVQSEMQKLKQEKLMSDYQSLQDQLNPHFLFNNLSVLKSLITYDAESALKFTDNFTDVYRYVLENGSETTIKLDEEIKFVRAIVAMHKERLGEGFDATFDIHPEALKKHIAPLSLQLLIENAIKHNIANKNHQLQIVIMSDENTICVENNIQLKKSSYSTQTGLDNLVKRYKLIAPDRTIDIRQTNELFKVTLPLL